VTLKEEAIYAQNLTSFFSNLELIIFISRHSSESGRPTLSVHTPGNLAEAELGGIPRRVSISPANAMRNALEAMARFKKEMRLDYEVSYEGTHHGPSLDVPTMFAELGSSLTQWNDLKTAEVVALSAMEAVSRFGDCPVETVLGIGGLHYNAKFTQMALESKVAFGHMIPKYAVPKIDSAMLRQCIERTLEQVDRVVLDWKGIRGEDKPSVAAMLKEIGISFEKV
jgi:D-aminoacyl-tRNA deacylase